MGRYGKASLASGLLLGMLGLAPTAGAATCSLVPQLRDVTINQGLGSYTPLVRGKETLVRLYLSMPSCASGGASMSLTSASLTVKLGTTTLATGIGSVPAVSTTSPPPIPSYTSAPLLDGTGDPKFVVPGTVLAPTGVTGQFTVKFSAVIGYQAKSGGTTTKASVTFTNLPGTTNPISATVDQRSNALRILVVPFGDPTQPFASQFSDAAVATLQNAMTTLDRTFPVPDGVSSTLSATSGGVRYQLNPSVLDLTAIGGAYASDGNFCGTGSNFNALKAELAQFLQSWNTANPGATADRVLGVVDEKISDGSSQGCAEGMASMSSPEAWIRAISSTSPSSSGALASMELAHTFGIVPDARDDPFSPGHSQNVQADVTSPNRAYNVTLRSFLTDDHTVMTLAGTWNNNDTVFEKADYELLHCLLGGAPNTGCTTSGTTGTSTGVAAGPVFVMSGTTDGSASGTNVVESYTTTDVARTTPDDASQYRLVQRIGPTGSILRNDGVPVSSKDSNHEGASATPKGLFSIAFPYDTSATTVQFWKGAPDAGGSIKLYERSKDSAPIITTSPIITASARLTKQSATSTSDRLVTTAVASSADPTFTVTGTGDGGDANLGDGVCDDGAGGCTLRAAIEEANSVAGTYTIDFKIPGTAPFTIQPASELPATTNPVTIDGTTQGGFSTAGHPIIELNGDLAPLGSAGLTIAGGSSTVRGLAINGFLADLETGGGVGLLITELGGDVVQGNYIGTDVTGTVDEGNEGGGIVIDSGDNAIGGTGAGQGNLVSGNGGGVFNSDGILVRSTGNAIEGNLIGVSATDTGLLENDRYGVNIEGGNGGNTIGGTTASAGNVIEGGFGGVAIGTVSSGLGPSDNNVVEHNTIANTNVGGASGGVYVEAGTGNLISRNSISSDVGLGIALTSTNVPLPNDAGDADTGSNDRQNYPVLTDATVSGGSTTIDGTLNSAPNTTYTIEVFSNPSCHPSGFGEGKTFLGSTSTTTDGNGDASFSASVPTVLSSSDVVTATATDPGGNTSEFSACRSVSVTQASVQTSVEVSDNRPDDVRVDFRAVCPGITYILDVAEPLVEGTASETNNPGPMCSNPKIEVFATDGFLTDTASDVASVRDPLPSDAIASIYGPSDGDRFLQFGNIPLHGGGNAPGDMFQWFEDGSPITGATEPSFDPPVPSTGWSVGDIVFSLRVTAPNGSRDTASVTVHVLADADNDGVPAAIDTEPCVTGGGDHDPTNSYIDSDGDGVPNASEVTLGTDPCVPNTSYEAIIDFNPDTLNIPSSGQTVTIRVTVPYRNVNDVNGSTVRITRLGGQSVSGPTFASIAWRIKNGVGIAKFDRDKLIAYLTANGLRRQRVAVEVEGSSKPTATPAPWTFHGSDSFFAT